MLISRPSGDARAPSIAVNARGDALLGWAQTDRMSVRVATAHYSTGAGWDTFGNLGPTVGNAEQVQVGLADDGRGLLVWDERPDPTSNSGLSATWSVADGFGPVKELLRYDPTIALTYGPRFASQASSGKAIALWGYNAGRGVAIQAFRYDPSAGWGPLTKLQLDPAATRQPIVTDAEVALGAGAVAFTAFESYGEPWVNRSTTQQQVGNATRLAAADSGGAETPRIAADGLGRALAVWTVRSPDRSATLAARFAPARGWGAPVTLAETPLPGDTNPYLQLSEARAVFTAIGLPCAAFVRPEPEHADVWTSCYVGGGWTPPRQIDVADPGQSKSLQISADGRGNWAVVWARSSGDSQHVYANRYALDRGWTGATRLDPDSGSSSAPVLALDHDGNGFAAWTQLSAYTHLLVSRLE